jgi:hypothetical protein
MTKLYSISPIIYNMCLNSNTLNGVLISLLVSFLVSSVVDARIIRPSKGLESINGNGMELIRGVSKLTKRVIYFDDVSVKQV